ncbi:acetylesterase [Kineococcus sp. T13]|uniref:dienelactone hydrolase family protein n=1 Tax=Kineococcus vitellinus TaxID=2696565 RepID=UPI001412A51C|nr:acetylxylan esterase [Kineococcus vitellinus]NAZ77338.1 acetylesterase [Kineococcus vitellinus]
MGAPAEPVDALEGFEDWPAFLRRELPPRGGPPDLAAVLGLPRRPPPPRVREEGSRRVGDLDVTTLSWDVGFGPRTRASLLRPAGSTGVLPGVLGLHCHGGAKWTGAAKLVDDGSPPQQDGAPRFPGYGGRAAANALARRGFAVLVHDAFSWGSRRFPLTRPSPKWAPWLAALEAGWAAQGLVVGSAQRYDAHAQLHEETLAKAAGVLGTTFAGAVVFEDLLALDVLAALPGTDPHRLGAFGFSGGGGRALLLAALDERVRAHVVACMLSTTAALVGRYLDTHSWLLHSPGLARFADLPDLTALRPLLVQYALQDPLFPPAGMRAAHERLLARHAAAGTYRGAEHPGGHRFDVPMQEQAWGFLEEHLAR